MGKMLSSPVSQGQGPLCRDTLVDYHSSSTSGLDPLTMDGVH